jgi:hypothetical protein
MPLATSITISPLPATITQASLLAAIRDGLIASGFPPVLKQYSVGTDMFCVWRLVFNPAKTNGFAFYRLKVTSTLVVTHTVGSAFNDSTNALTGALADFHSTTFSASLPVNFTGIQSSELSVCMTTQGTTVQFNGGWLRPEGVTQWDDEGFCKVFLATTSTFTNLATITPSPYGTVTSFKTSLNQVEMQDPDTLSGQRSSKAPVEIYGATNTGIVGTTSLELGLGANAGMATGSLHTPAGTTQEWLISRPGAGTLMFRLK